MKNNIEHNVGIKTDRSSVIYQLCSKLYYLLLKRHIYGITSPMRVLPNFFVIGVGRGGTTSLYHYLGQHPCIARAAYDELGFFDSNFHLGLNWYRSLFPTKIYAKYVRWSRKHFLTYDVTPSYIRRPWVARRMMSLFPHAKIIVVLRNPVDRTYSHYHMGKKEGGERRTFEDAIDADIKLLQQPVNKLTDGYFSSIVEKSYLARGFYAEQLSIWFNLFQRDNIFILSSEDLSSDTQKTLDRIFQFLNLPKCEIKSLEKQRVGNYERMSPATREMLVEFFKPYNKQLYDLLQRKFDWDI